LLTVDEVHDLVWSKVAPRLPAHTPLGRT
jgi:hypothetical protein